MFNNNSNLIYNLIKYLYIFIDIIDLQKYKSLLLRPQHF